MRGQLCSCRRDGGGHIQGVMVELGRSEWTAFEDLDLGRAEEDRSQSYAP